MDLVIYRNVKHIDYWRALQLILRELLSLLCEIKQINDSILLD